MKEIIKKGMISFSLSIQLHATDIVQFSDSDLEEERETHKENSDFYQTPSFIKYINTTINLKNCEGEVSLIQKPVRPDFLNIITSPMTSPVLGGFLTALYGIRTFIHRKHDWQYSEEVILKGVSPKQAFRSGVGTSLGFLALTTYYTYRNFIYDNTKKSQ